MKNRAAMRDETQVHIGPPILWGAEDTQQSSVLDGSSRFPGYHLERQRWSYQQGKSWRMAVPPPLLGGHTHTWPSWWLPWLLSGLFSSQLMLPPMPMCPGCTLGSLQKRGGQPVTLQACEASHRTAGLRARTGNCSGNRHAPDSPQFGT